MPPTKMCVVLINVSILVVVVVLVPLTLGFIPSEHRQSFDCWPPHALQANLVQTQEPGPLEHRGSCRLFLDTADTNAWDELLPLGIFHGVTTNPTILERCNQPCTIDNLQSLAKEALGQYPISEFMCQACGPILQ